jgi:hypothetical protein
LGAFRKSLSAEPLGRKRVNFLCTMPTAGIAISLEFEMPINEREFYHSENGDRWLLCVDDDRRVFVLHKANLPSGGTETTIQLGTFLGSGKAGPEHQALVGLITELIE